jgi:hypothetical protein
MLRHGGYNAVWEAFWNVEKPRAWILDERNGKERFGLLVGMFVLGICELIDRSRSILLARNWNFLRQFPSTVLVLEWRLTCSRLVSAETGSKQLSRMKPAVSE